MILIAQIAIGVFIGHIARACLLGTVEYWRKRKAMYPYEARQLRLLNEIRLVI